WHAPPPNPLLQRRPYRVQHPFLRVGHRDVQRGAGGEPMAATVEGFGDGGDVYFASGAEADFDAAGGLLEKDHADLDAGDAARVADGVFGVLRYRAGLAVIILEHFGIGDLAFLNNLKPLQHQTEQVDAAYGVLLI